jgi:hypothetical protein
MNLVPTQDWMILKLVERITPVTLLETVQQDDYAGFEVLAIGPWEAIQDLNGEWKHGINVGDIIVIEGLNAPILEFEGEKCHVARARNVCFKKVKDEVGS